MSIPFTVEQFFGVFRDYNTGIWPIQVIAWILGLLASIMVFVEKDSKNKIISAILAVFWVWTGAFYHLLYFSKINQLAYVFGVLFLLQGMLIFIYGTVKNQIDFGFQNKVGVIIGGLLIFYALILYPLIGHISGHGYPYSPLPGVAPCPTTILTFGLFLFGIHKIPLKLFWIPLLWSMIGISASWTLGVREDIGMVAAGLISGVLIISERYKSKREGVKALVVEK